ncbi:MAG: hypothetical protein KGQ42_06210 [Alphaproteobacteria bacterium]|nr:hypothetical protein [Alphaproteobacteria bacterium]MDE2043027.1 hypothetical protein [Alphaproteobacteria bacterium]MDE2340653.1 hypothetical protein [Alphaproteobacteria bacterium]
MIRIILVLVGVATITACGNRGELHPKAGQSMPVKPLYAKGTPSVNQLLTPNTQQRPQRGDDLLDLSKDRNNDPYDLPPVN